MNFSCQHVMKAFLIITVHYRNNICTITAVQTTLTYIIETTYSRGTAKYGGMNSDHHTLCLTIYSQYNQPKFDVLAASQVGHCLRNSVRFASPTGRLTPQLAEDPYLLTSSSKVSLQNVKLIVHKFKF
jgi:hypothetical protein